MYTTLVSTETLTAHLTDPQWLVVDCRYSLVDHAKGEQDYLAGHIAGAVYAHLGRHLSGPPVPSKTGRHPLPSVTEAAATFGALGIGAGTQVVAYDDVGGMVAGRLWWMLRWLGHDSVALLDGDWRAWQREGRPTAAGFERRPPSLFNPAPRPERLVTIAALEAELAAPDLLLFDARGADRFRGENETIDPRAGHIPGACSAPYGANLDAGGYWRPVDELRARFEPLLAGRPAGEAIFYCGSGVSAAHDLLALAHAGLGDARLYAGSWSEWITDPARPIATGE